MKPKQLKLPFGEPLAKAPRPDPVAADLLQRLARIESRLVQLMKHQGMTSDGRASLSQTDH